jgi:hypothetical protein
MERLRHWSAVAAETVWRKTVNKRKQMTRIITNIQGEARKKKSGVIGGDDKLERKVRLNV